MYRFVSLWVLGVRVYALGVVQKIENMKKPRHIQYVIALLLPMAAMADDRATIIGGIADGTPPPPAPVKELPEVEVRETVIRELPDRIVTINRVADPKLPDPRPKLPVRNDLNSEEIEAFRASPEVQAWLEQQAKTTHMFISATVIDRRATLLRWWHDGAEYQAWSNADWMILTGFSNFEKKDHHYTALLMAGRINSAALPPESSYRIPENLPEHPGTFIITQGDQTNHGAISGIAALHEIYRNDYARLAAAYELRERRQIEREAELKANPPAPQDVVLHYWKVQPERPRRGYDRKEEGQP